MKKLNKFILIFISMFLLGIVNVNASTYNEIFDVGDAEPSINFVTTDSYTFFTFDDGVHGSELWVTDGTPIGTKIVKDITEGESSSNISDTLVSLNNKVYFTIGDNNLWVSDGTESGTHILVEIGYSMSNFYTINNKILFNISGYEGKPFSIIASDGTEIGTVLLEIPDDVNISMLMMSSSMSLKSKDYIYFTGFSKTWSSVLWRTNGTISGTTVVWEPSSGNNFTLPYSTSLNNVIFGKIHSDDAGDELWATNSSGTSANMIKDIIQGTTGSTPIDLFEYNGKIYFTANDPDTAEYYETEYYNSETEQMELMTGYNYKSALFVSDGTEDGTHVLKLNGKSIEGSFNKYAVYNNILYFIAPFDGDKPKLWRTDGTDVGTYIVQEFENESMDNLIATPNGLYFEQNYDCSNPVDCTRLYYTNGTVNSAVVVTDNYSDSINLYYLNGYAYFIEANPTLIDDGYYGNEFENYRLSRYLPDTPVVDEEENTPEEENNNTNNNNTTNTNTTHTTTTGTKTSNNYNDDEIIADEEISSEEPIEEEISSEQPTIDDEEEISSEQETTVEEKSNNTIYLIIGGVTLTGIITIIVLVSKKMKSM